MHTTGLNYYLLMLNNLNKTSLALLDKLVSNNKSFKYRFFVAACKPRFVYAYQVTYET